jgi:hypothetical protein
MANESLTMDERDTLEYLSTVVDDISMLLEMIKIKKEL